MTQSAPTQTSIFIPRPIRLSFWCALLLFCVGGYLEGPTTRAMGYTEIVVLQEKSAEETSDEQDDVESESEQAEGTMAVSTSPGESSGSLYTLVGELPDWVQRGNYIEPESGASLVIVKSEPRLKQREAEDELEELLVQVVRDRVDDLFAPGAGKAIGIDLAFIQENLIQHNEQCHEDGIYHQLLRWSVPESNQEMLGSDQRDAYQCFAQLKLDREFENQAESLWEEQLVISRTMQIGLIALSTLLMLGLVFGYLSADHKTRGFYSRRLQTVGLAFLLIGGAAVWWLATRFSWL